MPFNLENNGYVKTQGIYTNPGTPSNFMYSDGDKVENFLSETIRKSKDLSVGSEELQKYIYDWPSLYHLSPKRADLLRPFADRLKNKKVLEIGSGCGAITRFLGELGCSVLALEGSLRRARITRERCRDLDNVTVVNDNFEGFLCDEEFDFVILVGVLEYGNIFMASSDNGPLAMLTRAKEFLTPEGNLIIAIENKIGLKYWAGAPEDHIGRTYYGIQDLYADKEVTTFGHQEIVSLLKQAAFGISEFMYPFPDYKFPDVIITDEGFKKQGFKPLELLLEKFEYFQNTIYDSPFNSNLAAYSLFNNQLLADFANSFLILAGPSQAFQLKKENQILAYVHSTLRKKQYCKQTTFLSNDKTDIISVARQLLYESNYKNADLQHVLQDESYIDGRILLGTILPVISSNGWATKDIISWSHTFYEELIANSFDKDNQPWLNGKYLDLTPFNIVLTNGKTQFFDLEWISNEDVPAYYVFFRGLCHSLWRILFVNNPEPGTPLQVVQLVTQVTKYYFQFDDAEFSDCKSRELKYFSGVSPFEMSDPFPPLELRVRNSDYQTLLETNKELSAQNENLSIELNRRQEQFNNEKSALLDEANRKQEQFDSEKMALLEEVKKKETFLVNDAKKKQGLLEGEKIAILDEAKKKETSLSNEVSYLTRSLKWYVDTYENRSILGVLKEKIKSLSKKKINRDTAGRSYTRHAGGKNSYRLNAVNDLKLSDNGTYTTTGADPFFLVDFKGKQVKKGWYWLNIGITIEKGLLLAQKLYCDYGRGFNEHDVWILPEPQHNEIKGPVRFQDDISILRFDPSTIDCVFSVRELQLIPLSKLAMLRIAFSKYRQIHFSSYNYFPVFTDLTRTFFKTGIKGVRNKLWQALNYTEDKTWDRYRNWCKLYDTISEEQLGRIKTLSEGLAYQPLFSIVMPVYNVPVNFLKKAIESVEKQTYGNWEFCIADDKSTNKEVIALLEEYQKKDPRIKVVFRETNGRISKASNSALALATGDYMVLLDGDDELTPHALYMVAKTINENRNLELIYSDEDKIDEEGNRYEPYFKTDWNIDLFYGQNMINHLGVYKLSLIKKTGGFRHEYEGSQDYDLALRCLEHIKADQIHHIPHILYHWRAIKGSAAFSMDNKSPIIERGLNALNDHLKRTRQHAVALGNINNSYRVKWRLPDPKPLVSIIIPTKDKSEVLSLCITSILEKTKYENFEILIIDNDSGDPVTLEYLKTIQKDHQQVKVYSYKSEFNFSAIVNYGVCQSKAGAVVLLNNDTEVINEDWLQEMVSQCMREDIGAVGAKLYYPNGQIQHAGVFLYEGHPGNHIYLKKERNDPGYFNKLNLVQDYSVVTAACLAIRRELYLKVGGLDEENLKVAYNDVDFCLKVREAGYRNLWTPFAQLIHHESLSRGSDMDEMNFGRFKKEQGFMLNKWEDAISKDPYFNPNLGHDTRTNDIAFPPRISYEWQDKEIK